MKGKLLLSSISVIIIVLNIGCQNTSTVNKSTKEETGKAAPKPLFRDPIFDGAADPSIIFNHIDKKWYMFYTNRRANLDSLTDGVKWVHGTKIGMAVSEDGGRTWEYKDTCNILYHVKDVTYWAPEVIFYEDTYHMYLTIVPGIFDNWSHPRYIIHLTSKDLTAWEFQSKLNLVNEKCIDACVFQMPDGNWRLYYNNELDGKSIYYADSPDLYNWTDSGLKVIGDEKGEGPKVFQWKEKYWMVVDNWSGLGMYYSDNLADWVRQPEMILDEPGSGKDDGAVGHHADVVVSDNGKAYIFYFTHPGRSDKNQEPTPRDMRRSSIQVAELKLNEQGFIECNRNEPVYLNLSPMEK